MVTPKNNNPGYILVLSLMVISATMIIVTTIYIRGSIFLPYMNTAIRRQQAQLLALSGIEIAISQLAEQLPESPKEGGETAVKKPTQEQEALFLLANFLPVINRWQTFDLKKKIDGIDGTIQVCIVCEQGKININQIWDWQKKKFKGEGATTGDWKKALTYLSKKMGESIDLVKGIETVMKKKGQLQDVTELLRAPEFALFKTAQFYEPPQQKKKTETETGARLTYLTDIFTIQTTTDSLQPWLLADSVLGLLGIKRAEYGQIKEREKRMEEWIKPFSYKTDWKQQWDTILKPVYTKELQNLPQGTSAFFDPTFEPKYFSALCYGTFGNVTQRIFAYLERSKRSVNGKSVYDITIQKIYWL